MNFQIEIFLKLRFTCTLKKNLKVSDNLLLPEKELADQKFAIFVADLTIFIEDILEKKYILWIIDQSCILIWIPSLKFKY